jgi:PHD/YefM family antitoxin component YafN of YafNO toxin-antitoxin module
MVQDNMGKYPPLYDKGDPETVDASDLEQTEVRAGTEVTVWSRQINNDERGFHGYGPYERSEAESFAGLDVVASGNGAGTADEDINGTVILAITNSNQNRVLASTSFKSLNQLRDALQERRTDRIRQPSMAPYAKPGRHLEVRIDADAASDGYEIDPSGSSGQLHYAIVDN